MEEREYRQLVDREFSRLGRAFDDVDPDVAEFELAQGAVSITLSSGAKCILSTQPSVRQIWLAAASQGIAYHFNYDTGRSAWVDDKGKGIELLTCVKTLIRESTGVELKL